ncbi:hypothetical protein CHLNCDRAFT_138965 [Chlorella variabilis]|uniref:Uncharacterized protein n=1 Tax=Chlorella variabilis TaxID=554065 RepID=E1ZP19_CHLVA|nr:hypothetical protein CHLNCDRAFT_138965 [Chlorella variabilis]EFN52540.1 hypothetical protein CHLNCDRAFT_138965 [Chlorella variabilis]|eukprot:XP_005844642.1 hypothetical protein CHLNCDRAFT_138965 [Chlorella variabilis]
MLQNKVAVITGAASGIGEAAARLFVKEGARVVLGDIQGDKVSQLAGELGGDRAVAQDADVAAEEDIQRLAATALDTFGGLDVWCSNAAGLPAAAAAGDLLHAGYYGRTGLYSSEALMESLDAAEFDKQVQVNLRGVVLGTKHAARAMKARGGGGGCIINTTSIAGLEVNCATHGDPAFVAAGGKHGVVALTKLAACELAPYRIRVNAVAPGYTATPMLAKVMGLEGASKEEFVAEVAKASVMPGVALLPEDIAHGRLYLASDLGRCVNGHTLVIDNGVLAGVAGYVPGLKVPVGV